MTAVFDVIPKLDGFHEFEVLWKGTKVMIRVWLARKIGQRPHAGRQEGNLNSASSQERSERFSPLRSQENICLLWLPFSKMFVLARITPYYSEKQSGCYEDPCELFGYQEALNLREKKLRTCLPFLGREKSQRPLAANPRIAKRTATKIGTRMQRRTNSRRRRLRRNRK